MKFVSQQRKRIVVQTNINVYTVVSRLSGLTEHRITACCSTKDVHSNIRKQKNLSIEADLLFMLYCKYSDCFIRVFDGCIRVSTRPTPRYATVCVPH